MSVNPADLTTPRSPAARWEILELAARAEDARIRLRAGSVDAAAPPGPEPLSDEDEAAVRWMLGSG